jgi:methyl-accepting chemotaxis protein
MAAENVQTPQITSPYTDAQTGNLCVTVSQAIVQDGQVTGVAAADMFIDVLTDIVGQVSVSEDSYAFLTDGDGNILLHPNEAYAPDADDVFPNITQVDGGILADVWQNTSSGSGASYKGTDYDGVTKYFTARVIGETGWLLYTAAPANVVYAHIYRTLSVTLPILAVVVFLAVFLAKKMIKKLVTVPIGQLASAAETLATGDVDIVIPDNELNEIKQLANAFRKIAETTKRQADAAMAIASGNLTTDIQPICDADKMGGAMRDVLNGMNDMLHEISGGTERVSSVSEQISSGAQMLAQGAMEQSSTIVELSRAIESVTSQSRQSTELAQQATVFVENIRQNAEDGTQKMELMMRSIQEINEAARSIEKVIKDIDDIAFQTNILALNAAVEAARAGEAGKGFAVVADEVRNLAGKSAESATNTAALIESTIHKAATGAENADETVTSLTEIIAGINQSVQFLTQILESSENQSTALAQVSSGIDQVSTVVQQNSATAEESAASGEQLTSAAAILQQLVARFRLKMDAEAPEVPMPYASDEMDMDFEQVDDPANYDKY